MVSEWLIHCLSLEPLKVNETDMLGQLPVSGDPGGVQSDTTPPPQSRESRDGT